MGLLFPDTATEVEEKLIQMLRQAPPWRKLEMVTALNTAMRRMMLSGFRHQYPDETDAQLDHRLAKALLGPATALQFFQMREGINTMQDEPISIMQFVADLFERLGIQYVIGGSMASAYYGVGRSTLDVDFVADVRPDQIAELSQALRPGFYLDEQMIADAIKNRGSFNMIHLATMFKVDVFIPGTRVFDRRQLQRRRSAAIGPEDNQRVFLLTPEDIILAKLDWYNRGGRVSDRQWHDVLGVILTQQELLDYEYIRANAVALAIGDLFEKALLETQSR